MVHSSTVLAVVVSDLAMLSFSAQPTKQVLRRHRCAGYAGIRDSKEVLTLATA